MPTTIDIATPLFPPTRFHSLIGIEPRSQGDCRRGHQNYWQYLALNMGQFRTTEVEQRKDLKIRLKNLQVAMVQSVKDWSQRMAEHHGQRFWQKAQESLRADGRLMAWSTFMEGISVCHRQDALYGLSELATKGISWNVPGGSMRSEVQNDFGVTFMHLTAMRIVDCLHTPDKELVTEVQLNETRADGKAVTVRPCGNNIRVFFGAHKGQLISGQTKSFILMCSANEDRAVRDFDIWSEMWPRATFRRDKKGGADDKLRDLARRINIALTKKLGTLPNGKQWVERVQGFGYALNSSVRWNFRLD